MGMMFNPPEEEHSLYYYEYDRNDINRENPFNASDIDLVDFWENEDRGDPLVIHPSSPDPQSINIPTNYTGFWKYNEDKTLEEVRHYLSSTYHAHYTSENSKTQTLDLIESIGDAEAFCRCNAIKYLSRFGKKRGKFKTDILKAIHYCVLLYHFSGLHNETTDTYETF